MSHVVGTLFADVDLLLDFVKSNNKDKQRIFIDIVHDPNPALLDRLDRARKLVRHVDQLPKIQSIRIFPRRLSGTPIRFIALDDTDLRSGIPFFRQHAQPIIPKAAGIPWPDQMLLSDVLDLCTYANLSNPMLTTTLRVIMTLRLEVHVLNAYKSPIVEQLATELLETEITSFLRDATARHLLVPVRLSQRHWLLCHLTKQLPTSLDIHIADTRTLALEPREAVAIPPEVMAAGSAVQLVASYAHQTGREYDFGFAVIVLAVTRLAPALLGKWEQSHQGGMLLELMLYGEEFNAKKPDYRTTPYIAQQPTSDLPIRSKAPEGAARKVDPVQHSKRLTTPSPPRHSKRPHRENLPRSKSDGLPAAARRTPRTASNPSPNDKPDGHETQVSAAAVASRNAAADEEVPETPAAHGVVLPRKIANVNDRESLPVSPGIVVFNSSPPTNAFASAHLPDLPQLNSFAPNSAVASADVPDLPQFNSSPPAKALANEHLPDLPQLDDAPPTNAVANTHLPDLPQLSNAPPTNVVANKHPPVLPQTSDSPPRRPGRSRRRVLPIEIPSADSRNTPRVLTDALPRIPIGASPDEIAIIERDYIL